MNIKEKLTSRKLWVTIITIVCSVILAIFGYATDSEIMAASGDICTMIAAAVYVIAEAIVDKSCGDYILEEGEDVEDE